MCQWDTTGIEYACGHYIVTSHDTKHDCGNKYCSKSIRHPSNCKSFECIQYYGPDRNQTTASVSSAYCRPCQEGFFDRPIIIRRGR